MKNKILIVDDEVEIHTVFSKALSSEYQLDHAKNGKSALEYIHNKPFNLVLLDLKLPDIDGMKVLQEMKKKKPGLPVIIITGFGSIEKAVELTKMGADDFIEKPFSLNKVKIRIKNVLKIEKIRKTLEYYETVITEQYKIIYRSDRMKKLIEHIQKVKDSPASVLILGETGVGKELVARAIHFKGNRRNFPFVKVNCASIPETLFESELFGHTRGAFTDAKEEKKGKAELAEQGTLFLDEIGEMSPANQAKVLHLIEDKEFSPLGSKKTKKVNIRIISASNKNLFEEVKKGGFREDLLSRLNVVLIKIPPLRERKEDIPVIAEYFIHKYCEEYNKPVKELSKDARDLLVRHPFRRNVRELRNLIEKIIVLSDSSTISVEEVVSATKDLDYENLGLIGKRKPLRDARKEFEKDFILNILRENNWNIQDSAKILGIARTHLYRKMDELGIAKRTK